MKLNENTLSILKNFTNFNDKILVKKGNVIKSVTGNKNVLAKAVLDQDFPADFALAELGRFINVVGLHKSPDVEFKEDHLIVREDGRQSKVFYADPELIFYPEKDLKVPTVDVTFDLSKEDIAAVAKAAAVLAVGYVVISGRDGDIILAAADVRNPAASSHEIVVGQTDKTFRAVIKLEYLKVLPRNYVVDVSSAGFLRLNSANDDGSFVDYFIAVESDHSTFE
jgi:gp45 sliding clamp